MTTTHRKILRRMKRSGYRYGKAAVSGHTSPVAFKIGLKKRPKLRIDLGEGESRPATAAEVRAYRLQMADLRGKQAMG
jgi:hypothetical protein